MSYFTTTDIAKHPDLSRYQTVDENASVMWLEKAQAGKVTLEHISDALKEYSNLFKAGLASKAEILTLSRAYPQSIEYSNAAGELYKSIDVDPIVIGGPASVELVDREGHLITTNALTNAFKKFMDNSRTRNVMVLHSDVQVGWALPAYISKGGQIFKSGVDDKGLFFICELRDDTAIAKKVADQINQGMLKSYSIAGSATKVQNMQKGETPYLQVDDMELAEVTVCEKGVNQGASFELLKAEVPQTGKIDKDQCGYRDATDEENLCGINCGHCKFFNAEDKTCDTVSGDIQPKDYCKIFAPRKLVMDTAPHPKKVLMVQVHRNTDDGKVNFHKSFDAWLSKEKDPLTSGESFVTLNNEAARQEEHQLLLREYGFPLEMDINAQRYVPVVEVETDEDGKPIHNLPPWVVNEAGEMLGDRLDEDAPTYKNSAKAKNRKKSGALQKLLINNYLSKLSQYDAEKEGILQRIRRGDPGVPGRVQQLHRQAQQAVGGREYHPFSYFTRESDHKRFIEELANKKLSGTISPEEERWAQHQNNSPHYFSILEGDQARRKESRDTFEADIGQREQKQKQDPNFPGGSQEMPFSPDEVDEMHRIMGIGGNRVFSHPNHHTQDWRDVRAELKDRHGRLTDGHPDAYRYRELHEHLADLSHLLKHPDTGHGLVHMNVNLPEGVNAFSKVDHHDIAGMVDQGHISFKPITQFLAQGQKEIPAEDLEKWVNWTVDNYRDPHKMNDLGDLGGSVKGDQEVGGGLSPQYGPSYYHWSAGDDPEGFHQTMTGRQRAGGTRVGDQGALPRAYDAVGEMRDAPKGPLVGGGTPPQTELTGGSNTGLGTPPIGQTQMNLPPPRQPNPSNWIDRPYQKSMSKSALELLIEKALGGR